MARTNTRAMHARREAFFQEGKQLDAAGDPAADCWICKARIDYNVQPDSTEDSHNLDHYFTVDAHPELQEDLSNFRHSHRRCNRQRGKDAPSAGLGDPMPDWW